MKGVLKLIIMSGIFATIIFYGRNFLFEDSQKSTQQINNIENFQSNQVNIVGHEGVALAVNLGTRHSLLTQSQINAFQDVLEVGEILANKQESQDVIISNNMILLNEYINVLQTDVRGLLSNSYDRQQTLEAYIDQLKYRYKLSSSTIQALQAQGNILQTSVSSTSVDITNLKAKIGNDFKNFDASGTLDNIQNYLALREEYTYARTYMIFISEFIKSYSQLNTYNARLIDTLANNREAIIKNTQVVIPDTGTEFLRNLDLLYSEEEWRQIQ